MRSNISLFFSITVVIVLIAACSSLRTPPIQKNYFDLEITKDLPALPQAKKNQDALPILIKSFSIAPEYDSHSFVYLLGENRYVNDFYNEFVSPPTQIITEKIAENLYKTGQFSPYLAQNKSQLGYRFFGRIKHLYFDLQESGKSLAILEIRITLERNGTKGFETVLSKTYSERRQAASDDPDDLARALSTALTHVINRLIEDLPTN